MTGWGLEWVELHGGRHGAFFRPGIRRALLGIAAAIVLGVAFSIFN
jgi:hypothetical protein